MMKQDHFKIVLSFEDKTEGVMKKEKVPRVDADPLLSRMTQRMIRRPDIYGSLEDMRDIQELERRFGNRADHALFNTLYDHVVNSRYSHDLRAFHALYISGHLVSPESGSAQFKLIRKSFESSNGLNFPYRAEALSWLRGDQGLVSRPIQSRIQTLFRTRSLTWPGADTENREERLTELKQSLLSPEFVAHYPLSARAAAKWFHLKGDAIQGDLDAIERYNEFRRKRDEEEEANRKKEEARWKAIQNSRAAAQLAKLQEEHVPPTPPVISPPLDRVEIIHQALSRSNRLPPRLPNGLGDGKSFNVGKVLLDDATPLDVFRLAFRDPLQINRVRVGWSNRSDAPARDALYAVCARSAGTSPSKTWKDRLDVLLEVLPEVELSRNKTTPLHLLSGASFSSAADRLSGMRAIERLFRKSQQRQHPDLPPFSAWMITDSLGATPFMRAVRAGDATVAHALFLLHPPAAMADDHSEVLPALVSHLDPIAGEKLLLAMARRRPSEVTARHIDQAMELVQSDNRFSSWKATLTAFAAASFVDENATPIRRVQIPEIVPGRGVTLPVLAGGFRRRSRQP